MFFAAFFRIYKIDTLLHLSLGLDIFKLSYHDFANFRLSFGMF